MDSSEWNRSRAGGAAPALRPAPGTAPARAACPPPPQPVKPSRQRGLTALPSTKISFVRKIGKRELLERTASDLRVNDTKMVSFVCLCISSRKPSLDTDFSHRDWWRKTKTFHPPPMWSALRERVLAVLWICISSACEKNVPNLYRCTNAWSRDDALLVANVEPCDRAREYGFQNHPMTVHPFHMLALTQRHILKGATRNARV